MREGERGGGRGVGHGAVMGCPSCEGERGKREKGWSAAAAAMGRGRGMSPLLIFHFPFLFLFPKFPILCLNAI